MKAVIFDVTGTIAHFRRPDTTATQLTYPFITPTAAKGLVGAILGITDFVTQDRIGIQLLRPVRTSSQQISMLGKDGGASFNRPTTMELLINPGYRLYYVGREYVDALADKLRLGQAVYHTYLGVAFALTSPKFIGYEEVKTIPIQEEITTQTVVPTEIIKDLVIEDNRHYSRAGGFLHTYLGNRTFEKSVSFIYESKGRPITFRPKKMETIQDCVVSVGGEAICLV